MPIEIQAYACSCASKYVPEVIAALNGGVKPAAMTIGGAIFYFEPPTDRMRKHEAKHVEQYARYAPFWARLFPLNWRAWLGTPRFTQAYMAEDHAQGYVTNKFEMEARAAEEA